MVVDSRASETTADIDVAVPTGRRGRAPWSWHAWAAVLLVAVGLAVRLRILWSPAGRLDGDEAIVALMALRMRGGHWTLFFWGQYYGGVVEQVLVAIAVSLHRSVLFVKLVPLTLSGVAGALTWRAARHVLDDERARVAGALAFAWPGTVWLATKEDAYYWVSVALVAGALLLTLRVRARDPRAVDCVLLGAAVGLAWYETVQTAFVLAPLLLWWLASVRPARRTIELVVAGGLLGAAPWLVGFAHDGRALISQPATTSSYGERFHVVAGALLPRFLGARGPFGQGWLVLGAGALVWCAVVVALVAVTARVLRRGGHPLAPIVVAIGPFAFVAAAAQATTYAMAPRYALMVTPFAAVLTAAAVRTRAALVTVTAVALLFGVANGEAYVHASHQEPAIVSLNPAPLDPLERALTARHVTRLYADYWIAYPLTFDHVSGIVASAADLPRDAADHQVVAAARARTWVVYADSPRDQVLFCALAARGISATRGTVGEFAVYDLDRYVDPMAFTEVWSRAHTGRHPAAGLNARGAPAPCAR